MESNLSRCLLPLLYLPFLVLTVSHQPEIKLKPSEKICRTPEGAAAAVQRKLRAMPTRSTTKNNVPNLSDPATWPGPGGDSGRSERPDRQCSLAQPTPVARNNANMMGY